MSETQRVLDEIDAKIGNRSDAVFSSCRQYRYALIRNWDDLLTEKKSFVAFCCLNPSVADELIDDPTIRRCIGYAKQWGFSGFVMLNAFAFRATDPKVMKAHPEPIGSDNNAAIFKIVEMAGKVVAAWGTHCGHLRRHEQFATVLPSYCSVWRLKATAGGFPIHPLYQRSDIEPELWLPKITS